MKPSNNHLRRKSSPAIHLTGLNMNNVGDHDEDDDEEDGKKRGIGGGGGGGGGLSSLSSKKRNDLLSASPRHEGS